MSAEDKAGEVLWAAVTVARSKLEAAKAEERDARRRADEASSRRAMLEQNESRLVEAITAYLRNKAKVEINGTACRVRYLGASTNAGDFSFEINGGAR